MRLPSVARIGSARSKSAETDLPPPVVAPDEYDEEYYLTKCAGRDSWVASGGADLDPMYYGSLVKVGCRPGAVVVDVGTGRAELPVVAVREGARLAVGIEYSRSALKLGAQTVNKARLADRVVLLAADARAIPLPSACADLVTLLDVVEHLADHELEACLSECHRVLRPGGRVLVHTMPNRLVYDVTYRVQRAVLPNRRKSWARDPRQEIEKRMHVNEQTRASLRGYLRNAGFKDVRVTYGEWIWDGFVPDERARLLYHRLARFRLTAGFGAGNLWGDATRL